MVGKATLVADPDLVDRFVLARHDALDHPSRRRRRASRRTLKVVLQPTGQCVQIEAAEFSSQGRAPKRKSAVVSAPTGQISVVLPEK